MNGDGYDDVVVGAEGYDGTLEDEGAVYLYLGSETGLQPDHAWMATGGQPGSGFGYAVSPAGDVNGDGYDDVLVGAYRYDNGETDEGRLFLYFGSSSGPSPATTSRAASRARSQRSPCAML